MRRQDRIRVFDGRRGVMKDASFTLYLGEQCSAPTGCAETAVMPRPTRGSSWLRAMDMPPLLA